MDSREATWTKAEADAVIAAARHAPVWCPEHPWVLELHARTAELYELRSSIRHDPAGRDRLLSCGAAVTNLRAAVRAAGWQAEVDVHAEPGHPDLVATVRAGDRRTPDARELATADAIAAIGPLVSAPRQRPVPRADALRLAAADDWPDTQLQPLDAPAHAVGLARLALHAADKPDGHRHAARELASWLHSDPPSLSATAARIAAEQVLVVLTPDDNRRDQVLAGAAVQTARLAAHPIGLVVQPLVAVLHQREVRAGLIEELGLPGYPQALLRIGRPAPRTHHRPLPVPW